MKNYRITVNGTAYDVAVEELGAGAAPAAVAAPAPVAAAAPAPAAPAAPAAAGSIEVAAPMPGKILNVKAGVGTAVKKGDVILILEAMKMENNINADRDGKIIEIKVNKGDSVLEGADLVVIG